MPCYRHGELCFGLFVSRVPLPTLRFGRRWFALAEHPLLNALVTATLLVMPVAVLRALLQLLSVAAQAGGWEDAARLLQFAQAACATAIPLMINIHLALLGAAHFRLVPGSAVTAALVALIATGVVFDTDQLVQAPSLPLAVLSAAAGVRLLAAIESALGLRRAAQGDLVATCLHQIPALAGVAAAITVVGGLLAPVAKPAAQLWSSWVSTWDVDAGFWAGACYELARGLSWLVGVNGHHVFGAASEALMVSSAANMQAARAGQAELNILSNTFFDVWSAIGGAGNTLSLLLAMLLIASSSVYRRLARTALPFSALNVNEPVIFGVPIFYNPIMALPFLLAPLAGYVIAYGATWLGLVPRLELQTSWMLPPFLNVWVASGGAVEAVLLQVLIVAVGAAIYLPFFVRLDRGHQVRFTALRPLEQDGPEARLAAPGAYAADTQRRLDAQREVAQLQAHGRFVLRYQPQVELASGRIVGAEVLLRHEGEDGQLQTPQFLASFRQLGLVADIDFWVLESAIDEVRRRSDLGAIRIAINLSPPTLLDERFPRLLDRALAGGLPHGIELELEVTEQQGVADEVRFAAALQDLRQRGVAIALDDFGSGYSTLAYLSRHRFDLIKIDRSLLLQAEASRVGAECFAAVVRLARVGGAAVLVEGIETDAQAARAIEAGAALGQGYRFARPMSIEQFAARLEKANCSRAGEA